MARGSKKMGKRVIAPFVLACLATLIITAPASLLDAWLQKATQNRVVLANTGGTVWNGSATVALRKHDGGFIALQPLHWDIDWPSLFIGGFKVRLHWDGMPAAAVTEAIFSVGKIELRHVQITVPVQALGEISPLLKPAQFHGQFQVQGERLVFSARGMEGAATVDWQQAGSALSHVDPLGDYRVTLSGQAGGINIGLATNSGVLLLEGQGNWSAGQGLTFHGKAEAASGHYDELAELLHNIGPEISPQVHSFTLTPQ
jgi:general secretion pathway protein N